MTYLRSSFFIFAILLMWGCTSINSTGTKSVPFEEASLAGMVYSADSRPVRGAHILIDEEVEARSDINGRFVTEPIAPGAHSLQISKEGFEPQTLTVDFTDRLQVLYINLISFDSLLEKAEEKLDGNDYSGARSLLQRASKIDPDDPALLMLQLVAAERTADEESAIRLIEKLAELYPDLQISPVVRQKR